MLGFLNSQRHNFGCNLRRLGIDLDPISVPISPPWTPQDCSLIRSTLARSLVSYLINY